MQILMEQFQMISISLCNFIAEYFFMKSIFRTKHEKKGVLIWSAYTFFRLTVYQLYVVYYLGRLYSGETWYKILNFYVMFFFNILFFVMLYYVFAGELLKIILYSFPVETIVGSISMACQYLVVGKIDIKIEGGASLYQMALIWTGNLLAGLIFYISYRILSPVFIKIRSHTIKYVKFTGLVMLGCYFFIIFGNTNIDVLSGKNYRIMAITMLVATVLVLVFLSIVNIFLYNKQKKQKESLDLRLSEMLKQTDAIEYQVLELDSTRTLIHQILKEMEDGAKLTDKQMMIGHYLAGLQNKYNTICSGIYCANHRMDAFLVTIAKENQMRNIQTEIHFQGYTGLHVDEKDLETIIWTFSQIWNPLLEMDSSKKWSVYATDQNRNLILFAKYESPGMDREEIRVNVKECRTQVESYLKKYHGVMTQKIDQEKLEIKMMLESSSV